MVKPSAMTRLRVGALPEPYAGAGAFATAVQRACQQGASAALLVRPAQFGCNIQTAGSNRFQRLPDDEAPAAATARAEFEQLCAALRQAGVRLCVVDESRDAPSPDAVFPNNWVSFHEDGTVVLYPMQAGNRRVERRAGVVQAVCTQLGFTQRRLIDLTKAERAGRYLEGTGSLVLDHLERVVYACRSSRTDEPLARRWARLMDYEPVIFDAYDQDGARIYHTNVLLCVGSTFAVVCSAAIAAQDRARVLTRLRSSGRELVQISIAAMGRFAANLLELRGSGTGPTPDTVLALSAGARAALDALQLARLSAHVGRLAVAAVPIIERCGGGSVRCMIAEVRGCRR